MSHHHPALLVLLGLFLCPLLGSPVQAQEDDGVEALLAMDLGDLMKIPVMTASRHAQELWRAPAVITVLEGEDLRRAGYRSLAEALARVPGFYGIDDSVGQYAVVRGVGSGQRAYGRTLKVMLDGQALGMRSDASQFLGPELIPMGIVQRIEIVHGPASALYGADAYLGVINIITRDKPATRLAVAAGHENKGGSASLEAGADMAHGSWSALVTGMAAREDRSGRELPSSSPLAANFVETISQGDVSRPASFYARVRYDNDALRQSLALHASQRDNHGEFLDFGTLSHDNRVAVSQQTLSWQANWAATETQAVNARVAYAWGGQMGSEQLSLGQTASYPAREFGYRSWEAAFEHQFARDSMSLVAGLDGAWDTEAPFEVFNVDSSTGNKVQISPMESDRLFRNVGFYLQYQWQPSWASDWNLSANWRRDDHNLYGARNSYRLGLTGRLLSELSAKLLYGTSFKAPNATQLYGNPVYTGDALGNQTLEPETATTGEGQLLWQARSDLLLTLSVWHMQVHKLIELQPFGINQRWDNRGDQAGTGVDSEVRWQGAQHRLSFGSSWHDTIIQLEQPLVPTVEVPTASAPRLITRLDWSYRLATSEFGLEGRHVSARRASDSNIDSNLKVVYTLPAYEVWRLHAMYLWGAQRLNLAVDNVFDKNYSEPGYGGVDLPAASRRFWLGWTWEY